MPKLKKTETKNNAPANVEANATATETKQPNLTRDANGVIRNATNFEQSSNRDTAYLLFFGNVMRANNHTATLRQIHDAGKAVGNKRYNPHYTGSAKATDIGAINRLKKAGYLTASADGYTLSATDLAKTSAAYNGKAK